MRGYWLPPGCNKLAEYDGFFIKSDAVYTTHNPTKDWDSFMLILKGEFISAFRDFKNVQQWERVENNQSRYVVLDNGSVKLITDDIDGFIAVYLIASAQASVPDIRPFVSVLQSILCKYYANSVYKRINYRKLKKVEVQKIET